MKEADRIYQKANKIIDFLDQKAGAYLLLADLKAPIDKAYHEGNIRVLRTVIPELSKWVSTLPKYDQDELGTLLSEFEMRLTSPLESVEKIINKGIVENVAEYRILIDATSDLDLSAEMLKNVNHLISNYHGPFNE